MKSIQITTLIYEMLLQIAKRNKMKPNEFISKLIEREYASK